MDLIISLKINMFSPWYRWKIAELALIYISLTHTIFSTSWKVNMSIFLCFISVIVWIFVIVLIYFLFQASLEVMEEENASIWFSGKEMQRGKKLKDFVGKNEKTKIIAKIQKVNYWKTWIIWFSNLKILSIHDGYFKNISCTLN